MLYESLERIYETYEVLVGALQLEVLCERAVICEQSVLIQEVPLNSWFWFIDGANIIVSRQKYEFIMETYTGNSFRNNLK